MTVGQGLATIPCQFAQDLALLVSALGAAGLNLLHSLPGTCFLFMLPLHAVHTPTLLPTAMHYI